MMSSLEAGDEWGRTGNKRGMLRAIHRFVHRRYKVLNSVTQAQVSSVLLVSLVASDILSKPNS